MKERILILKYARDNPNLVINTNSEFFGHVDINLSFIVIPLHLPPVLMTNNSSERVF